MTNDAGSAQPTDETRAKQMAEVMKLGPHRAFGLRVDQADPDRVTISWDVDERHLQSFGHVHGGVYCTVVEIAASIGAALWLGDRGHAVGVSNHTDFLRPAATGDTLTAVATPLHRGHTQQLWEVTITNSMAKLTAHGQLRLANTMN